MDGSNIFAWLMAHPLEAILIGMVAFFAIGILSPANITGVFAYRNKLKILELQLMYGTEEAKTRAKAIISKANVKLD